MNNTQETQEESFIPADHTLPEITVKAVILSIILTFVLAAANAYLGLKVGLTISASIPAAVISMAVLRFFKESNILENNIVQTAASAGEALTGAIVFTIPALILIQYWSNFNYWQVALIAALGGTLGVLFSVPLRRVLLAQKGLRFPEGVAIANVLKASAMKGANVSHLLWAGLVGALISLCETGFKFLAPSIQKWFVAGGTVWGIGVGFNPALFGAGYIIGGTVGLAILLGIVVGWVIGVPIIAAIYGVPDVSSDQLGMTLWGDYIRYMGLGVMVSGGIWAVFTLVKPVYIGVKSSIEGIREAAHHYHDHVIRTERDLSILSVLWGILIVMLAIFTALLIFMHVDKFSMTISSMFGLALVALIFIFIVGFILSSVCGYFAGLVGSSANPLSSMSLIALFLFSFIVLAFLNLDAFDVSQQSQLLSASGFVIIITAFVAGAASISNDTIQDLKTGQMVGATPWKQQLMLIVGVISASLVIPLVLKLLFEAYGIGGVFPRPGMDHQYMLLAPQANLMAAIVDGVFHQQVKWAMILTGIGLGLACIIADMILKRYGKHLPVLAFGIGVYLPFDTSTSLVLGGLLSMLVHYLLSKRYSEDQQAISNGNQIGLLMGCGLVAGAALVGVILAVPFIILGSTDALALMPNNLAWLAGPLSVAVTVMIALWFIRETKKAAASS